MPNVQADRLIDIANGLLVAAGASAEEAATIARYNIGANLVGHDSHGIILIPTYIERIKVGHIVPGAPWNIIEETPTTTVIDGNWGFGYVVTDRAMRYTIDKAKKQNVAATTTAKGVCSKVSACRAHSRSFIPKVARPATTPASRDAPASTSFCASTRRFAE